MRRLSGNSDRLVISLSALRGARGTRKEDFMRLLSALKAKAEEMGWNNSQMAFELLWVGLELPKRSVTPFDVIYLDHSSKTQT